MAPDTEVAWAAGFFDGEGNTCASRTRGKVRSIHMSVSQCERSPLERFVEAVGHGIIHGPYARNGGTTRPIWTVRINGRPKVAEVLELLRPYLCEFKIAQAEEYLAMAPEPRKLQGHGTDGCYQRGCRCDLCVVARSEARRKIYQRKKALSGG